MKKMNLILCLLYVLVACEKNDDPIQPETNLTSITNALISPNGLKIVEFIEDGQEKTNSVSKYLFQFSENNVVLATTSSESIEGSYLLLRDDKKTELKLNFRGSIELYELSDDWCFISESKEFIHFADKNDILKFSIQ